MSTARQSDWWILGMAIVIVAGLVIAGLRGYVSWTLVQSVGLSGTAVIVLWYTIETTRLRREAEARATRDREPHIYFDVQQADNRFPNFTETTGPGGSVVKTEKHILRFIFINHSPNSALARVRVRLGVGAQVGVFPHDSEYGGEVDWRVTPFFQLFGVFDLIDLIRSAQETLASRVWPDRPMVLSVQVDLYWPNRQLFESGAKEYHVRVDLQKQNVEFWPEVNTRSLGVLPCPKKVPEGPTPAIRDAPV